VGGLLDRMEHRPGPPRTDSAGSRTAERRRARQVLWPALAISVLLHLLALLRVEFRVDFQTAHPPPQIVAPSQPVMRAFDLVEVAADVAPIDAQILEREVRRETEADVWVAPAAGTPQAEPGTGSGPPPRDRLQYRMGSTEVWRPQAPLPQVEPTADERVQARVAAELKEYNDSVAAEDAARARALDWTVTDRNGNKWGVSPGKIHLGSIERKFGIELPRSPELAEREKTWTEIQLQAGRAETQAAFDERVRAIRERMERERARQNPGGGTTAGSSGGGNSTGGGSTGGGG
jgi:uncharacterized membrane protein YgcG